MAYDDESSSGSWLRRNWKTALALVFLVGLAAFFRVAFNYDAALNDGNPRFAGNDDYYHLRAVRSIESEGRHLTHDPLLNYPIGAINPRPPLYNWHVAMAGRVIEFTTGQDTAQASAYALEWSSALWGSLTVIPVWLIGRSLYSNRAGLWAGFLLAASAAYIQRSGFGLGDHDAFIMFWLVLGTHFLLRALRLTRDDTRVEHWGSYRSVAAGFGEYIDTHREGLAYAFLAGLCWSAIAVSWEGFPYAMSIYAVYYGLQLLTNQIRRRDSTGDVLVMVIVMGLITLIPLPYYWTMGHTGSTITTSAYIVGGLVVATLALVPTRDLPSILVLPSIVLVALLGWAVLRFVFPDIGEQVFSANGYFLQNKLYSTIAEAQRTDLGVFVFSIGFMTFFLALVGFVYAIIRVFRHRERDQLYIVGWGLISIYMAFAAARFVFNAAPVFAVLGGWMVDKLVTWMNWRERVREFQAYRHESLGKAVKSILGAKQVAGSLFLVVTLVAPNVWFAFDAGFPSEVRANYRQNHPGNEFISRQTGAFGQGFLGSDWIDSYAWFATQDRTDDAGTQLSCADRPGHMAWWDYGFWEVALGCHPTVADNFQNGFDIAARFLIAQSEKEAIEWMSVRLIEADWRVHRPYAYGDAVLGVLGDHNASLPAALPSTATPATYDALQRLLAAQTANASEAAGLYDRLSQATGHHIGYFLTDLRMLPYDVPETPDIESGSIFYAPTFLANKNPDDFVQTLYKDQRGSEYRVVGYEVDEAGNSRQLSAPKVVGPDGAIYFVGGGRIIRSIDGNRIDYNDPTQGQGYPMASVQLDLKTPFYQSMYYRGYIGGDGAKPGQGNYHEEKPGNDLQHFRLVRKADTVHILKFYLGAPVSGRVTLGDGGAPVEGATAEAYDEMGIRHAFMTTGPDGRYELLLPPSAVNETTGELSDIQVRFQRGGVTLGNQTFRVTDAQAMRRAAPPAPLDLSLAAGSLDVFAYIDRDSDGLYNATIDPPASGANMGWGTYNATAGPDGHARLTGLVPGGAQVTGVLEGYTAIPQFGTVPPGGEGSAAVAFQAAEVTLEGTALRADDGTPVEGLQVNITAKDPATEYTKNVTVAPTTDAQGNFTARVQPGGTYLVSVSVTRDEDGVRATYTGSREVDVAVGAASVRVDLTVAREASA